MSLITMKALLAPERWSRPGARRLARAGVIDRERVIRETLTSIKRAGADLILTYHAVEAARWLG